MFGYGDLFTLCDQQFSMWFTCCSLLMTLISFMLLILTVTHQFSLFTLWGSCWALGFVLSCPKGQDTLVSFSLLPVVHEQVDMPNFLQQYDGFKKLPSSRHHCCQSNIIKSKSRIICTNYITHVTSITACRYNLSQNRLKCNRVYIT